VTALVCRTQLTKSCLT